MSCQWYSSFRTYSHIVNVFIYASMIMEDDERAILIISWWLSKLQIQIQLWQSECNSSEVDATEPNHVRLNLVQRPDC